MEALAPSVIRMSFSSPKRAVTPPRETSPERMFRLTVPLKLVSSSIWRETDPLAGQTALARPVHAACVIPSPGLGVATKIRCDGALIAFSNSTSAPARKVIALVVVVRDLPERSPSASRHVHDAAGGRRPASEVMPPSTSKRRMPSESWLNSAPTRALCSEKPLSSRCV